MAPYFGTVEKPECHMLYNVRPWRPSGEHGSHKGCKALKSQMETVRSCPPPCTFLNYLRCHDDIGWDWIISLEVGGMRPGPPLRNFWMISLQEWIPESFSWGVLYRRPGHRRRPVLPNHRLHAWWKKQDSAMRQAMEEAVRLDTHAPRVHAVSVGHPCLYSGDEVGQGQ